MKVIIDTNVLVSAALKGRKPASVIQIVGERTDLEWVVSTEILTEYREVLNRRKLNLGEEVKREWLEIIDTNTIVIDVNLSVDFPRDRKDAKFLACAIVADADFFITGDRDFTDAQNLVNTTIISVSSFLDLMSEN